MGRLGISKIDVLGARHPGLVQKVDAMFEAFIPLRAVAKAILAQYGERLSHTSLWTYKRESWNVRRDQALAREATLAAYRELASEERN